MLKNILIYIVKYSNKRSTTSVYERLSNSMIYIYLALKQQLCQINKLSINKY